MIIWLNRSGLVSDNPTTTGLTLLILAEVTYEMNMNHHPSGQTNNKTLCKYWGAGASLNLWLHNATNIYISRTPSHKYTYLLDNSTFDIGNSHWHPTFPETARYASYHCII
jgi:hypothetical protein